MNKYDKFIRIFRDSDVKKLQIAVDGLINTPTYNLLSMSSSTMLGCITIVVCMQKDPNT